MGEILVIWMCVLFFTPLLKIDLWGKQSFKIIVNDVSKKLIVFGYECNPKSIFVCQLELEIW